MGLTLGDRVAVIGKGWRKISSREEIGSAQAYIIVNPRFSRVSNIAFIDDENPSSSELRYDSVYVIDFPEGVS